MANAIKAMGLTFGVDGGTVIANLTDVSRSGASGGMMDTTNLSSTGGKKTYESSGVFEEGDLSISFNWDPSNTEHKALVTDWQAGTSRLYKVLFGDGVDFYKADLVPVSFDWTNALEGKLEATVAFKHAGTNITDPS